MGCCAPRPLLVLVVGLAVLSASPAAADDGADCSQRYEEEKFDAAIAACTRAIASGRYRGRALVNAHLTRALSQTAKDRSCHCRFHRGDPARPDEGGRLPGAR